MCVQAVMCSYRQHRDASGDGVLWQTQSSPADNPRLSNLDTPATENLNRVPCHTQCPESSEVTERDNGQTSDDTSSASHRPVRDKPTHKTPGSGKRSEEHTSELQSLRHLVCRLLLEKKK